MINQLFKNYVKSNAKLGKNIYEAQKDKTLIGYKNRKGDKLFYYGNYIHNGEVTNICILYNKRTKSYFQLKNGNIDYIPNYHCDIVACMEI